MPPSSPRRAIFTLISICCISRCAALSSTDLPILRRSLSPALSRKRAALSAPLLPRACQPHAASSLSLRAAPPTTPLSTAAIAASGTSRVRARIAVRALPRAPRGKVSMVHPVKSPFTAADYLESTVSRSMVNEWVSMGVPLWATLIDEFLFVVASVIFIFASFDFYPSASYAQYVEVHCHRRLSLSLSLPHTHTFTH
eukprot:710127-Pleurochrysis_carterae.AAC.4